VLVRTARGHVVEGFYDGQDEAGRHVWRDVGATELRDEDVPTHWAELPRGIA
jgi:hypothetical protein